MALTPGTLLRQYRIVSSIGAGGMGEVYRAHDTNLARDVAIKVLPAAVAQDEQKLARLEREAKAIAALSHPNILAVYDFGTDKDGTAFIVTELLEGESLRDRLEGGHVGPRKATEIGCQIARGLAAAQDKGIVHRDLKPDNVFLTKDGRVRILDFGLATAALDASCRDAGSETDDRSFAQEATRTRLTNPGTVLGTVDYMSPEQVRGEPTDHRSDIFALGIVLYEMASGTRAFHRDTHAETMTAILKEDPPELASLSDNIPPGLATIIRRCLEKRSGERFHSAHDLAFSLEALSSSGSSSGSSVPMAGVRGPGKRVGAMGMVGLVAVGLLIGAAAMALRQPQLEIVEPASFGFLSSRRGTVTNAQFTPGNNAVVYSARWEGEPLRLYPASAGVLTSEPLGTQSADVLSISPSGELALLLNPRHPIGWETIGTLAVAPPGGAAARPVLEDVLAADWAPDGLSMAVAHEVDGIVRLEYPIGTVIFESRGWISGVQIHPDGERILITDNPARGDNASGIRIVDRSGTVVEVAIGGSWGALWAPDGETIWYSNGYQMYSVRPGEQPRIKHEIASAMQFMDVDSNGRVLGAVGALRREMFVQAPGVDGEANLSWLDWSTPWVFTDDGRIVLFEEGNLNSDEGYAIYMRDTQGGAPVLLKYGSVMAMSPDKGWIAVISRPFGESPSLALVPTGPGESRALEIGDLVLQLHFGAWVPGEQERVNSGIGGADRGTLYFAARRGADTARIYRMALTEGGRPLAVTPDALVLGPLGHVVSRDGSRLIVKPVDGAAVEFDTEGNGPKSVPGVEPSDLPLRFDRTGEHLFVQASSEIPAKIVRVTLATGERELWRELAPLDSTGVFTVDKLYLSEDGENYVYSARRVISRVAVLIW